MKRIVALLSNKIDKIKIDRKINRINRVIDSAIDNAQEKIEQLEDEKFDIIEKFEESSEVAPIINRLSDKIGEIEYQEEIIQRLKKVQEFLDEEIEEDKLDEEVEEDKKDKD